jgi:hypothetical protein
MRVSRFVYIVAGIAAGSLFAVAAAQASAQTGIGATFSVGSGPMEGASRQPYTATWTEKTVQRLANGTTITRESTTKFARDSSGRTYSEMHQTLPAGSDGQPRELVMYHIFDTVTRTTTMWNSNTKEATVTHRPEQQLLSARPAQTLGAGTAPTVQVQLPDRRQNPDVQREDLGTKNIVGVNAKGMRVMRVIPAGREGNDQPITTTSESWRSTEYGIVLMSVNEDPRYGTTTHEVTEFTPGEPDAGLFHVPEGYTVREVTPRTVANQ